MTETKQGILARVLREAGRVVDVAALLASLRMPADAEPGAATLLPEGAEPSEPGTRFRVSYEYSEVVEGETRRFLHHTVLVAESAEAARAAALAHFDQLERLSGVGWGRTLLRYRVAKEERADC